MHSVSTVRLVVPGGAGDAMATPYFGRSVNPISTMGGILCSLNNTGTPGFSDLPTTLYSVHNFWAITKFSALKWSTLSVFNKF